MIIRKLLRIYVYMRFGMTNYFTFLISLFNTASLVWYFTSLRKYLSFPEFLGLFFLIYTPLAVLLGYYDTKKLVSKSTYETNPYWRRPTFIERKRFVGAIMTPVALLHRKLECSEECKKCSEESLREHMKYVLSDGKYNPRSHCFCDLAYKLGLLDEEHYRKCIKVATSEPYLSDLGKLR
ncbi:hypothetical protein IPA_05450 [Ignicoccus pacificus DSM 13166]|uniref:Uncharacterized protein n=1 Tax=Ignicoccus pacificus DSM 13166 TaxID=940294 RepID=A0A977KBD8_9CREN|nr:hypothetical protein IPA_05450 [Ignicoccus pacificus DSM 13166]